jgi:hypothetical protein
VPEYVGKMWKNSEGISSEMIETIELTRGFIKRG